MTRSTGNGPDGSLRVRFDRALLICGLVNTVCSMKVRGWILAPRRPIDMLPSVSVDTAIPVPVALDHPPGLSSWPSRIDSSEVYDQAVLKETTSQLADLLRTDMFDRVRVVVDLGAVLDQPSVIFDGILVDRNN